MRDRLTTLAGALLALIVIYGLFFPGEKPPIPITRPLTTEQGPNGYFAFYEWLIGENVDTYSLRERFSSLDDSVGISSETGNILITTLPYFRPIREVETEALLSWIVSGNTLLVLAAINDSPDWATTNNSTFIADLKSITGIDFVSIVDDSNDSSLVPDDDETATVSRISLFENTGSEQAFDIVPRVGHPLMKDISVMRAASDFRSSVWRAEVDQFELIIELASMKLTDTPVIWQRKFGDGQIVTVGSGSLLTNRMIASADNRIFVANLVRNNLGSGATVIFDDLHQGLSVIYDPDAFFSDSRLHHTVYFIVAFWLLYILGSSNRLLDLQREAKPLRQSEFIVATGGFINRHLSRSAVGLWMYQSWFNDLRRHMGLQLNGEPVWQELRALPMLDSRLLGALQRKYERLTSNRNVNLIELHNTIHKARKAIG